MPVGLLLAGGIFNLAYTMLIPLVHVLKTQFVMEFWEIGFAFGGFAFSKALFQPVGGIIVDRIKPLPTVLGGLVLVAVSLVGLANATSGLHIILWRLIWGASEGITMPGFYKALNLVGKQTRLGEATLMGWFGSAAVFGMAAGVLLTGFVYQHIGYQGTFLIGALCALISATILWISMCFMTSIQESSMLAGSEPDSITDPEQEQAHLDLLLPFVVFIGLLDAINNGLYGAIEPILPLRLASIAQDPVWVTAVLFFHRAYCLRDCISVPRTPSPTTQTIHSYPHSICSLIRNPLWNGYSTEFDAHRGVLGYLQHRSACRIYCHAKSDCYLA